MDDKRFERELKHKEVLQKQAETGVSKEAEQVMKSTSKGEGREGANKKLKTKKLCNISTLVPYPEHQ